MISGVMSPDKRMVVLNEKTISGNKENILFPGNLRI
jgi:ABC-type molybdate transport system ATPase subunit